MDSPLLFLSRRRLGVLATDRRYRLVWWRGTEKGAAGGWGCVGKTAALLSDRAIYAYWLLVLASSSWPHGHLLLARSLPR